MTLDAARSAGCRALGRGNDLRFLEDVHTSSKSLERGMIMRASAGVVRSTLASGAVHPFKVLNVGRFLLACVCFVVCL